MAHELDCEVLKELVEKDIIFDIENQKFVKMKNCKINQSKILTKFNNSNKITNNSNNIDDLVVQRVRKIRERFVIKEKSESNKGSQKHFFNNDFNSFVLWWANNCDKNEGPVCYYCGTSEVKYKKIFENSIDKNKAFVDGQLHQSKKNSFNSEYMEIDKKDSTGDYDNNNCVFACHICNNAKSDLISAEDFKKFIGGGISNYIKYLDK